jgi:tripartite-type tricarboxylate transporter receptor subunit TctC
MRRVPSLPEIPTLTEAGLTGFDVALWIGIAAPAGTPAAIVAKLNREMTTILNTRETRDALQQQEFVAEPAPPGYLADRIRDDPAIWRAVVAKSEIEVQ